MSRPTSSRWKGTMSHVTDLEMVLARLDRRRAQIEAMQMDATRPLLEQSALDTEYDVLLELRRITVGLLKAAKQLEAQQTEEPERCS